MHVNNPLGLSPMPQFPASTGSETDCFLQEADIPACHEAEEA